MPHLETFRQSIENAAFIVRTKSRKKQTSKNRGRGLLPGQQRVKITISIGVAAPDSTSNTPDKVMKAADKALYKAKKRGETGYVNKLTDAAAGRDGAWCDDGKAYPVMIKRYVLTISKSKL